MTHRERVMTALAHRRPDRAPRTIGLVGAAMEQFKAKTGSDNPSAYWDLDLSGWVGFAPPAVDWHARFARYYEGEPELPVFEFGEYPPEWGIASRKANYYHFSAPRFPLRRATTVREIETFPFPDYVGEWKHDHLEGDVARLKAEGHPVIGWAQRMFQNAWYLRSRDELFVDTVERPAIAEALFANIERVVTGMAVRFAEAGVDILSVADDIGMQDRMMIAPDWWRRWVKPHWKAVFTAARKVNPGLSIWYHTDGYFEPVIPDLIEIGVTLLNTVQPECMDPFKVKRQWGRDVSLAGTIGVQSTLRWSKPSEVRETVKRHIGELGADGGFILSPANAIEPDVPWENIVAFMEAANG